MHGSTPSDTPAPHGTQPPAPHGTQPPAPHAVPTPTPARTLAIVAVALGVLWLGGVGSVAAIVVGVVVLRRRSDSTTTALSWVAVGLGALGVIVTIVTAALLLFVSTAVTTAGHNREVELELHDAAWALEQHRDIHGVASLSPLPAPVRDVLPAHNYPEEIELTVVWVTEDDFCLQARRIGEQHPVLHLRGSVGMIDGTVPCPVTPTSGAP